MVFEFIYDCTMNKEETRNAFADCVACFESRNEFVTRVIMSKQVYVYIDNFNWIDLDEKKKFSVNISKKLLWGGKIEIEDLGDKVIFCNRRKSWFNCIIGQKDWKGDIKQIANCINLNLGQLDIDHPERLKQLSK